METPKQDLAAMPQAVMQNWQQASSRVMRAQQHMANSMLKIVQLEMRFGQEFIAARVAMLQSASAGHPPATSLVMEDMDRSMAMLRNIAEELQKAVSETARLMTEETSAAHSNGSTPQL